MSDNTRHLRFDGLVQPIEVCDSDDVLSCFDKAFRGWTYSVSDGPAENPVLRLSRKNGSYRLEGPWVQQTISRSDRVDALCAFIAEFIRAYVTQDERLLCLHGAAAEFAGRLVVFPNRYRAGKSVLSASLAASGIRLFADDVLPIGDDDRGIAPGFAPRLRLPLPDDLSPAMRDAILRRAGVGGEHYLYLDLDVRELAPRGTAAPVGAIVLLEREPGTGPNLTPVSEGEMLTHVIWQNFAREAPPSQILDRLHRLVAGARRFRLRYGRAEDAVPFLQDTFAEWPDTGAEEPLSEPSIPPQEPSGGRVPTWTGEPLDGCYSRTPGIKDVMIDGERFLADSAGAAIYHLNPVASAVWHLLSEPKTRDQVVGLMHEAFPDIPRERIAGDVGALIGELSKKQLLVTVS